LAPSEEPARLGVDEAGRGSLVGPLVVAGVLLSSSSADELRRLGVRDSKELSPKRRSELFEEVLSRCLWHRVVLVPPRVLDERNLNEVTLAAAELIVEEALESGWKPELVIIDAVGLKKGASSVLMPGGVRVIMEPGADKKYVEVSAASIVAKVTRDEVIAAYRRELGLRGSGYPSDPETVSWLLENAEKIPPGVVRLKWKTLKKYKLRLGGWQG